MGIESVTRISSPFSVGIRDVGKRADEKPLNLYLGTGVRDYVELMK